MSVPALCHSPLGAAASVDFGPAGSTAGLAVPTGSCVGEGLYVGCRPAPEEPWALLPFFSPASPALTPLPKGRFGRFLAAAGDKWMIGPMVFKLCTPFDLDNGGDARFRYAPVLSGYVEFENTHSDTTAELVFGFGRTGSPLKLRDAVGFAFDGTAGIAAPAGAEVAGQSGDDVFGCAVGPLAALRFRVPPRSRRVFPLVIGFHLAGFHHATDFADVAAVLEYGLREHARYLALADRLDAEFMRSTAEFATKTRVSEEVRRWLAQSRRVLGEPEIDLSSLRSLWQSISA